MRLKHLIASVWKNYSLLRAYENDFVKKLELSGRGIDLGAKSTDAKYYEYIDISKVNDMDFVDYYHSGDGVIKMDLEKTFPIDDETYEFALSFNVMEHIYNYELLLSETYRILKKNGKIHGMVPLIWHFHPDPNDYFRFTEQALERLMNHIGFRELHIEPIAYGPFKVAATQVGGIVKIRVIKFFFYLLGMVLDWVFDYMSKGSKRYAIAYYFSGVK